MLARQPLCDKTLKYNTSQWTLRGISIQHATCLHAGRYQKRIWKNITAVYCPVNTLRPRLNGPQCTVMYTLSIFNLKTRIPFKIALNFVSKGPIKNSTPLVQVTAWQRTDHKSLAERFRASLLTYMYAIQSQWVNKQVYVRVCSRVFVVAYNCVFMHEVVSVIKTLWLKWVLKSSWPYET